jgi:predicted enzyme related to lactoylglutathione lyase
VNWFEIPTDDLDRAAKFYEMLLDVKLRRETFGEPYVLFPSSPKGVGGGLVQRDFQRPSDNGALVYLNCDSGLDAAIGTAGSVGDGEARAGQARGAGRVWLDRLRSGYRGQSCGAA